MSLRRLGSPVEQFVNEPSDDRDLPVNHFVRVAATFTNMDQREQKIAIGIVSLVALFSAILGNYPISKSYLLCKYQKYKYDIYLSRIFVHVFN